MHRIAQLALEPAAIYPVIRLQMANGRLYSLPALEPPTLLRSQRLAGTPFAHNLEKHEFGGSQVLFKAVRQGDE
jgi:hypothetical protein